MTNTRNGAPPGAVIWPKNPQRERVIAGLNVQESSEYRRILSLEIGEISQEELDYFQFLNKRVLDELQTRSDPDHCRPDYLQWEQRNTCYNCAAPLDDNPLVKDAKKMNTVNTWAKSQLKILADMAEHRGLQFFADEARKIADGLLNL